MRMLYKYALCGIMNTGYLFFDLLIQKSFEIKDSILIFFSSIMRKTGRQIFNQLSFVEIFDFYTLPKIFIKIVNISSINVVIDIFFRSSHFFQIIS